MPMVDPNELNRTGRLIEMNRQRLEEARSQISRIESLQLEHDDTRAALEAISAGSSGHIPLGAGVMVKIPPSQTTLIDFGSGIFGETYPDVAKAMVSERLSDLGDIKKQFESDFSQIQNRIDELVKSLEETTSELSENNQSENLSQGDGTTQIQKPKRRRKVGRELTLDD